MNFIKKLIARTPLIFIIRHYRQMRYEEQQWIAKHGEIPDGYCLARRGFMSWFGKGRLGLRTVVDGKWLDP
jgi:hypothetical protein